MLVVSISIDILPLYSEPQALRNVLYLKSHSCSEYCILLEIAANMLSPCCLQQFSMVLWALGIGIVENSTVLGFASTVRFYHGFLNGLLMTFLGYETTQWNAWLNLPELESS